MTSISLQSRIKALEWLKLTAQQKIKKTNGIGLCWCVNYLKMHRRITAIQETYLLERIKQTENRHSWLWEGPGKRISVDSSDYMSWAAYYIWKPGSLKPRINWINKQLKIERATLAQIPHR